MAKTKKAGEPGETTPVKKTRNTSVKKAEEKVIPQIDAALVAQAEQAASSGTVQEDEQLRTMADSLLNESEQSGPTDDIMTFLRTIFSEEEIVKFSETGRLLLTLQPYQIREISDRQAEMVAQFVEMNRLEELSKANTAATEVIE